MLLTCSRKPLMVSIAAFIILSLIGIGCITVARFSHAEDDRWRHRSEARLLVSSVINALHNSLGDAIASTISLAGFVAASDTVNETLFYEFAEELSTKFNYINSLQLQPKAVVTWSYPNQDAVGHDLLNDPKRRQDVLNTIAKEDIVIAGPFNLIQGGFGMIARFPVWKGKPKTMETWWGLVGALIMVDELLDDSIKLTDMFKGYYYDLRFWDPNTRRMRWIRNNTDFDLATLTVDSYGPIVEDVSVRDALHWQLLLLPKNGWSGGIMFSDWVVVVVLALILAIAIVMLIHGIIVAFWFHQLSQARARVPAGKVCMVFTDIQDITELWELDPEGMQYMVMMHDNFFRNTIAEYGGYEVKTESGAFFIAFRSPVDAIHFSLKVQTGLLQVEWPENTPIMNSLSCRPVLTPHATSWLWRGLRVRMGIHIGCPEMVFSNETMRGDYSGRSVNFAARVAGFARGGEIVLSSEVVDEVPTSVLKARDVVLTTFGTVNLKGLSQPVTLHQLLPAALHQRTFCGDKKDITLHTKASEKSVRFMNAGASARNRRKWRRRSREPRVASNRISAEGDHDVASPLAIPSGSQPGSGAGNEDQGIV